jgi:regulator of PEP synthase PpsR (kinase-PPPase family)
VKVLKEENLKLLNQNIALHQSIHDVQSQMKVELSKLEAQMNDSNRYTSFKTFEEELANRQAYIETLQKKVKDVTDKLIENEVNMKSVHQNHEIEVKSLKAQLEEQRSLGLRDQEEYARMLDSMKRKFESLMTLHDQSMVNANTSESASSVTINVITKKLHEEIDHQRNQVQVLQQELILSRNKNMEIQNNYKISQLKTSQLHDSMNLIHVSVFQLIVFLGIVLILCF